MNDSTEVKFLIDKKWKVPKNSYKSSIFSKNIDWGVDVKELKKVISEQIKKNYNYDCTEAEGDYSEGDDSEAEGEREIDQKSTNEEEEKKINHKLITDAETIRDW